MMKFTGYEAGAIEGLLLFQC
ncbi:hypothetical protein ACPC5U_15095 [Acinetobacter haemolyticus]